MERRLERGDYVPDGAGGFRVEQGAQALLQRVLFKLTVRRGSFPFLPELGSRLYTLSRERPSARESLARQYAAEALAGEELSVAGAAVHSDGDGLSVQVDLDWQGSDLSVTVEV